MLHTLAATESQGGQGSTQEEWSQTADRCAGDVQSLIQVGGAVLLKLAARLVSGD